MSWTSYSPIATLWHISSPFVSHPACKQVFRYIYQCRTSIDWILKCPIDHSVHFQNLVKEKRIWIIHISGIIAYVYKNFNFWSIGHRSVLSRRYIHWYWTVVCIVHMPTLYSSKTNNKLEAHIWFDDGGSSSEAYTISSSQAIVTASDNL